ncbi:MAG: M36 family metallopeptidase [Bacteroidota bacterium]|nr:M36 family metallopeptidase [Bacteroidota bacterium]
MKTIYFFLTVMTILILTSITLSQNQEKFIYKDNMRIDAKSNIPVAIYNVNSRQYSGTPEEISRQYLHENKMLLGLKDNLEDLKIMEIKESPAGHHIGLIQNYKGIPVMRSEMVISINKQNRISMVVSGYKPNISVNIIPGVKQEQALQLAKQAIDAANSKEVFPPRTDLVIYEDSLNIFHLVWKFIIFPLEQGGEWLIVVDAHNGNILELYNTLFDYVNGKGRVFDPDPVTALQNSSLTDQDDADYYAIQPAYIDNVTLSDLNDAVSSIYYVRGKYGWSMDVKPPYDAVSTAAHPDGFRYKRNQNGFEEVNVYYFIDKQRRYIGSLGFNPTWKYLGIGSSAIAFDARGYDSYLGERNAGYYPVSEYMIFGVPASYVDAGEDQSVILHEYGHALHDALIYRGTDDASTLSDTRGISEGLSDYLGISYRRSTQTFPFQENKRNNWFNPEAGESILPIADAQYPDHWGKWPYEKMNVWASTLMDMEYNTATVPYAGTRLGRDVTTKLVLTSLKYVNSSCDVLDNVNAILQADRDIYGSSHLSTLARVFYNRGFFKERIGYHPSNLLSGNIETSTTWSVIKWVEGNVTIKSGVTVSVPANTYLFIDNGKKIYIETGGTLIIDPSARVICYDNDAVITSQVSTTFNSTVVAGWNMVSIPQVVANFSKPAVYPNAVSDAFTYEGRYVPKDILANGIGYWVNFGANPPAVNYTGNSTFVTTVNINRGWNLIGTISAAVYTSTITTIPTNIITTPFLEWNGGYVDASILQVGKSYWVKANQGGQMIISSLSTSSKQPEDCAPPPPSPFGEPPTPILASPSNGATGVSTSPTLSWNPFSGATYRLQVSSDINFTGIVFDQSGITTTYKQVGPFSNSTTYYWRVNATNNNGTSYWSCPWNFATQSAPPPPDPCNPSYTTSELDRFIISDASGKSQPMYTRNERRPRAVRFSDDEMPPEPLGDIFHARFTSGKFVESISPGNGLVSIPVKIKNASYPLTIHWDIKKENKINYWLLLQGSNPKKIKLSDSGNLTYETSGDVVVIAQALPPCDPIEKTVHSHEFLDETEQIPSKFNLSQNYPNPFNPSTIFQYDLPEACYVTLKIYNALGQEVATLVDRMEDAGYKVASFNASNLPSGVYIYKLTAGASSGSSFTDVKKMIVAK